MWLRLPLSAPRRGPDVGSGVGSHSELGPNGSTGWPRVLSGLRKRYVAQFDDTQSIGRRYRRQDEIGTPLCVTVDFDSLDDNAVTIRDRDTQEQIRVPVTGLLAALEAKLGF